MVVCGSNNIFAANFATRNRKWDNLRSRLPPTPPEPDMPIDIDEYINSIDTTLTPEQREKVEKLKKQIHGGAKSPRCKSLVPFFYLNWLKIYFSFAQKPTNA
jgi:hypothetical protein